MRAIKWFVLLACWPMISWSLELGEQIEYRKSVMKTLDEGVVAYRSALQLGASRAEIAKHLKVLGAAGLIEAGQVGQTRPRRLKPEALRETGAWFEHFAAFWGESFDRLDEFLQDAAAPPAKGNDDA